MCYRVLGYTRILSHAESTDFYHFLSRVPAIFTAVVTRPRAMQKTRVHGSNDPAPQLDAMIRLPKNPRWARSLHENLKSLVAVLATSWS